MKSYLAVVAVLAVVVIGVTGVVLGEADDSPGLQGLGVLLVGAAVALGVRAVRRARGGPSRRAG
jgi:protein-S-isoprenylcysteine O-methyltransferase Ste14